MTERPLLFSAPMVRALLAGTKTQTRRVVKSAEPIAKLGSSADWDRFKAHPDMPTPSIVLLTNRGLPFTLPCPYGKPGDRLWVRESGWERPERTPAMMREGADTWAPYYYAADGEDGEQLRAWGFKARPSIHMPRWASRILLEVVGVHVERLQDISERDAEAEGAQPNDGYAGPASDRQKGWRDAYRKLWLTINGPESWATNPWVWVVDFRRVELMKCDVAAKKGGAS
jgi:hypothetical protein